MPNVGCTGCGLQSAHPPAHVFSLCCLPLSQVTELPLYKAVQQALPPTLPNPPCAPVRSRLLCLRVVRRPLLPAQCLLSLRFAKYSAQGLRSLRRLGWPVRMFAEPNTSRMCTSGVQQRKCAYTLSRCHAQAFSGLSGDEWKACYHTMLLLTVPPMVWMGIPDRVLRRQLFGLVDGVCGCACLHLENLFSSFPPRQMLE